jgi:hypothetical protein
MSHLPSVLRRAGAALCLCILVGGVLSGCAPKKPGATATPAATLNPNFAQSATLAQDLAALGPISGSIVGTQTAGAEQRTLSGSVALNGTSSQIELAVNGTITQNYDEIIVAGHRYTSRDGSIWADRGAEPAGTDLASILAHAGTSADAGINTVEGIVGHEIMSPQDKVDVAPAMGLDIWTFDRETTTLHIWADPTGKPIGFGASMDWRIMIGGVYEDVASNFDVMFASTAPVMIAAPAKPWKWEDDRAGGIALAHPSDDWDANYGVEWSASDPAKLTLSDAIGKAQDSVSASASGTKSALIDSEDAFWFTTSNHLSLPAFNMTVSVADGDQLTVLMVIHEKLLYTIVVVRTPAEQLALNALAMDVFASVEFTR